MIKIDSKIKVGFMVMIILLLFTSCQLGRFVFYNFADIKDYKNLNLDH
jgi:hypothetical protein